MFTAEIRTKRQKNGNVHTYTYYRCTRKSKTVACREPHIRAEALDKQLSDLLLAYAMPTAWADKLRELIHEDEAKEKTEYSAVTVRYMPISRSCPRNFNVCLIAT